MHFSTQLVFELEQFLSDLLEIQMVSVILNYLQKYLGLFRYVENYSSYKAFSRFFYKKKKNFVFETLAFFQK